MKLLSTSPSCADTSSAATWATRNRIAHGYIHIDLEMIRATVERDIPMVEGRLRAEIE